MDNRRKARLLWGAIPITVIYVILVGILCFTIYMETTQRLVFLLCCLAALGFAWMLVARINAQVQHYLDRADAAMEAMLNGKERVHLSFNAPEESVFARFEVKLERLYQLLLRNQQEVSKDKALLQELVGDISHQVKTPLTNLQMYLSILEGDNPADMDSELLVRARHQVEKLEFLLQSLVKMSRLEVGVFKLRPEEKDIYSTLAQALGGIVLAAEEKDINVTVDCQESITAIHDSKWTQEALFNILDNAVKYTPVGGSIKVAVEKWECNVRICITDTGSGIPESIQGQVFGRFYRGPGTEDQPGVGIGLYLAREIIKQQHGYITIQNSPVTGAEFCVYIPC